MSIAPQLTALAERDQAVFRTLVSCFSEPGTIASVPIDRQSPSHRLLGTASTVCRCLLDHEVSFAILGADDSLAEHMLRVTGSRIAEIPEADYIVVSGDRLSDVLEAANVGTDEFPDDSATVIVIVDGFGKCGTGLSLAGPGIPSSRNIHVQGVRPSSFELLSDINLDYPLGLDVVLAAPNGSIACLPRTTRIELAVQRERD